MVEIRGRQRGNTVYYYLEHAFRINGKVTKKELYLGKKVPSNIDVIKLKFLKEIYDQKWYSQLDKIKKNYKKDISKATKSELEKELEVFMIKFTYDTQKIEGSTLTLRETANLLQHNITPSNKPTRDVKEAEAHSKIFYQMLDYKKDLGLQVILSWHYELLNGTRPDIAGKIRTRQVWISGSKFVPPAPVEVYVLLKELFGWYDRNKGKIHPVELASLMHLKFVTIHPFIDGNGRMSRVLMNFILHKHGFPMLNIPYKNRTGYYNALERAQVKKIDSVFVTWVFRNYIKNYKRYQT
ncbi:MAG: Fic family protein [Candidatus Micrarchaeota archaeon]|nr:Fic family protein [Candidatus Micrarchaeota archaeon]